MFYTLAERVHGWLTIALHCGAAQKHSGGTHEGRGREGRRDGVRKRERDGERVDKASGTLANQKYAACSFNQRNALFLLSFFLWER